MAGPSQEALNPCIWWYGVFWVWLKGYLIWLMWQLLLYNALNMYFFPASHLYTQTQTLTQPPSLTSCKKLADSEYPKSLTLRYNWVYILLKDVFSHMSDNTKMRPYLFKKRKQTSSENTYCANYWKSLAGHELQLETLWNSVK